jgi:hypothetical protein
VGGGRRAAAHLALCERDPVQDDRQDVVEVVRHAAGEHAEALELLRLPDALGQGALVSLDPPPIGDVADDRDTRRPPLVRQRPAAHLRDERGAVPSASGPLVGLGGSAPEVLRGVRVQHDAIAREPDGRWRLVEESLQPVVEFDRPPTSRPMHVR